MTEPVIISVLILICIIIVLTSLLINFALRWKLEAERRKLIEDMYRTEAEMHINSLIWLRNTFSEMGVDPKDLREFENTIAEKIDLQMKRNETT